MDTEVAEEFPRAVRAAVPDNMTMAEVEETMAAAAAVADRVMAEAMPETAPASGSREATPQALLTGEFRGADRFHQGSGNATHLPIGRRRQGAPSGRFSRYQRAGLARAAGQCAEPGKAIPT